MVAPWKTPFITALLLCGTHSVSSQSTDFSSDLWVGHCNLEFLDARLYLIREVPYEEVPIIDLSVQETEEYVVEDSCVLRTTYRGKVLDHPIGVSHFEVPGMTLEIRPTHTYMLIVRDFTMPPVLVPLDTVVTSEPIVFKSRSFVVPGPATPEVDEDRLLELLKAAQAEATVHHGCKNMPVEELYARSKAQFGKGTNWNIEPERTYLDLVFRWEDDGPQEQTLVLELEWEPGLR